MTETNDHQLQATRTGLWALAKSTQQVRVDDQPKRPIRLRFHSMADAERLIGVGATPAAQDLASALTGIPIDFDEKVHPDRYEIDYGTPILPIR
jgi:hypothetical protein